MSNVSLNFFCDEPIKCGYVSDFVGGEYSPFCKKEKKVFFEKNKIIFFLNSLFCFRRGKNHRQKTENCQRSSQLLTM
jgi:hypothetical protein